MRHIELDHRELCSCAFALIDPLCADKPGLQGWGDFPQHELTPLGFEAKAAQLPKLVVLRDLPGAAFLRLVGLLSRPPSAVSPCVALLQSKASTESMVKHLRYLLAPTFPQGRRGVFRFYDPIVFEHLQWMLALKALVPLFGSVENWIVPLRGEWCIVPQPEVDPCLRAGRFYLDVDDWRRVSRIGLIHETLQGDPAWCTVPSQWGPQAEVLLTRAERHHLTDRDDAVMFAIQGLRWDSGLDMHPRVARLLADSAGHPARYRRLTGGWVDADWQAIAAELEHSSNLETAISSRVAANNPSQGMG